VPDGAAGPVLGLGDGIEPGLGACFPGADYECWGAPFGHCDGHASASTTAGRQRPVPPGVGGAAPGKPSRVGGRGRRSFRWSVRCFRLSGLRVLMPRVIAARWWLWRLAGSPLAWLPDQR
jgi:hypothetical protein